MNFCCPLLSYKILFKENNNLQTIIKENILKEQNASLDELFHYYLNTNIDTLRSNRFYFSHMSKSSIAGDKPNTGL